MMTSTQIAMPLRMMLGDAREAWTIVSGAVDVFQVDMVNGVPQSGLDYLGTLEAGSILLGMGAVVVDGVETTAMAQASGQVVLEPVALEGCGAAALDGWITCLSEWCAPGLAPSTSVQVDAGQTFESSDGELTLVGKRSVAWVRGDGLSLYGGGASALLMLPVTRYAWVVVGVGQQVVCLDTAQWLDETSSMSADLAAIHAAMMLERKKRRSAIAALERERFQTKVQRDGRIFATALNELTAPLLAGDVRPIPADGAGGRGALEACQAVGSVMGLAMVAPDSLEAGATAEYEVKAITDASRVRYRQVILRDEWWTRDQGPMIGFTLNGASAVAFLPKGSSSYEMLDPVAGTRTKMNGDLSASLDAKGYVFYRSFPSHKLGVKDLLLFGLRNGKRDLAMILGVGMMSGILAMALPIATGVLFDEVIPESQRTNLIQLSIILFSASVATFLMGLGQSFALQRLEGRMESEMEAAVWDRLLNLRTGFFRQFTTGDLAARSLAINQIRHVLTGTVMGALLNGVFSLFSFALLFGYSLKLALVATGLAALAIVFSAVSTAVTVRIDRQVLAMQGTINGRVSELLQGVAKFRISGTEPRAFARWASEYTKQKQLLLKAAKVAMASRIFNLIFPLLTAIVIYMMAADMVEHEAGFSIGHFLAFNAAFGQFLGATLGFSGAMLSLVSIIPTYERAKPILEELPELKLNTKRAGKLLGGIEVSHVSFRYKPDGPLILNDISFSVKPGQYVAFVGESGCGKSTMMRLLLGFEQAENGSVSYDGQDLAELDAQDVRKQIGVVLQAGKLMATDVFTNIIGASLLTMNDAWAAADAVGLGDDIRAMPMGMHTVINETGGGLSGGQRQRMLIARSIANKPRILFFDEATSALDNKTQATVSKSMEAMQATRIVIAHRLSTILHANLILVFKAGRLHESGTYDELMAMDGYFAELAKRQIT